ncbi:ribonuclease Z [Chitinimonas lacunae]|uniref:Ribonuclease Z n=1 Tax=Chitinimonas lacunae TaxID=1963018 RepID=A0ABV8MQQ0_9NEIS
MFKMTFLGTSSGVPTKTRNVSALAIQTGQGRDWVLFDCGEATQHRLLHTPLSVRDLTAICITHVHGDHCYGLPGLLASAAMNGRREPLLLLAPKAVLRWLDATIECSELFLPYPLECRDVAEVSVAEVSGCTLSAHRLSHRVESHGYAIERVVVHASLRAEALRAAGLAPGPDWKRLQAGETVTLPDGRVLAPADFVEQRRECWRVVVGGDNDDPGLLADACRGAQLLVHETTYTEEALQRIGPGPMHSSAARVARFAAAAGLPNLIMTHFSPRYQDEGPTTVAELAQEARAEYSGNLLLARDFDRYELGRDGVVRLVAEATIANGG